MRVVDDLSLRPLRVDDAEAMADVLADAALYAYIGGEPPTRAELEKRYAAQVRGCSPDGSEEWVNLIIERGADREPIGYVQATITEAGSAAEIAWVIGTAWQRRGYGQRSVQILVERLRARGIGQLVAHIHPAHTASQHIAAGPGMRPTERVVDDEVRWVGECDHAGEQDAGSRGVR